MNVKSGKMYGGGIKLTALVVAFVFTMTSVAWSTPATAASAESVIAPILSIDKLAIPAEMGTISREFGVRSAAKEPRPIPAEGLTVILIQDAHAVVDAQENIKKILMHLGTVYGVRLAALEGAKGRLEPILMRTFPEQNVLKKVLAGYESRAELSGPELASVYQEHAGDFFGMEDWKLYEQNYAAYLAAQSKKDALIAKWKTAKQGLDAERSKVYDEKLNEFHTFWDGFLSERISLMDLMLYLAAFQQQLQPAANGGSSAYTELPELIKSIGYEKTGKQEALAPLVRKIADEFKTKYLRGLGVKTEMNFYSRYQAFLTGQLSAGEMLQYLVKIGSEHGKRPKLTPQLMKLLGHTETLSAIKGSVLYEELDRFIPEAQAGLIKTKEQAALAQKYRKLFLMKNLIELELTHPQLARYQKEPDAYLQPFKVPAFEGFLENLAPALEFYQVALRRDQAFLSRIDAEMEEKGQKTAVVVAGGFHTNGLERILKEKGMAYAVVTPKIASLVGSENYSKVMKGDVSFKDYLKTTYFDALMRHAAKTLVEALPIPDRVRTLKNWRDNVIRELAKDGRITEAGKYLPYIDEVLRGMPEAATVAGPNPTKDEVLSLVKKELGNFKRDSLERIWKTFEFQLGVFTDGLKELVAKKELTTDKVATLLDRAASSKPVMLAPCASMGLFPDIGIINAILRNISPDLSGITGKMATADQILEAVKPYAKSPLSALEEQKLIEKTASDLLQHGLTVEGFLKNSPEVGKVPDAVLDESVRNMLDELASVTNQKRETVAARLATEMAGMIKAKGDASSSAIPAAPVIGAISDVASETSTENRRAEVREFDLAGLQDRVVTVEEAPNEILKAIRSAVPEALARQKSYFGSVKDYLARRAEAQASTSTKKAPETAKAQKAVVMGLIQLEADGNCRFVVTPSTGKLSEAKGDQSYAPMAHEQLFESFGDSFPKERTVRLVVFSDESGNIESYYSFKTPDETKADPEAMATLKAIMDKAVQSGGLPSTSAAATAVDLSRAESDPTQQALDRIKKLYPEGMGSERGTTGKGIYVSTVQGRAIDKLMLPQVVDAIRAARNGQEGPFRILELGSGEGILSFFLAARFPGAEVSGIEYDTDLVNTSDTALENAKAKGMPEAARVKFARGDFTSPQFAEDFTNADILYFYEGGTNAPEALAATLALSMKKGASVVTYGNMASAERRVPLDRDIFAQYFDKEVLPDTQTTIYKRNNEALPSDVQVQLWSRRFRLPAADQSRAEDDTVIIKRSEVASPDADTVFIPRGDQRNTEGNEIIFNKQEKQFTPDEQARFRDVKQNVIGYGSGKDVLISVGAYDCVNLVISGTNAAGERSGILSHVEGDTFGNLLQSPDLNSLSTRMFVQALQETMKANGLAPDQVEARAVFLRPGSRLAMQIQTVLARNGIRNIQLRPAERSPKKNYLMQLTRQPGEFAQADGIAFDVSSGNVYPYEAEGYPDAASAASIGIEQNRSLYGNVHVEKGDGLRFSVRFGNSPVSMVVDPATATVQFRQDGRSIQAGDQALAFLRAVEQERSLSAELSRAQADLSEMTAETSGKLISKVVSIAREKLLSLGYEEGASGSLETLQSELSVALARIAVRSETRYSGKSGAVIDVESFQPRVVSPEGKIAYDANGRLASVGENLSVSYDDQGRPKTASVANVAEYPSIAHFRSPSESVFISKGLDAPLTVFRFVNNNEIVVWRFNDKGEFIKEQAWNLSTGKGVEQKIWVAAGRDIPDSGNLDLGCFQYMFLLLQRSDVPEAAKTAIREKLLTESTSGGVMSRATDPGRLEATHELILDLLKQKPGQGEKKFLDLAASNLSTSLRAQEYLKTHGENVRTTGSDYQLKVFLALDGDSLGVFDSHGNMLQFIDKDGIYVNDFEKFLRNTGKSQSIRRLKENYSKGQRQVFICAAPGALQEGLDKTSDFSLAEVDAFAPQEPTETYDVIRMYNFTVHLNNNAHVKEAISKAGRLLNDNGFFIVGAGDASSSYGLWQRQGDTLVRLYNYWEKIHPGTEKINPDGSKGWVRSPAERNKANDRLTDIYLSTASGANNSGYRGQELGTVADLPLAGRAEVRSGFDAELFGKIQDAYKEYASTHAIERESDAAGVYMPSTPQMIMDLQERAYDFSGKTVLDVGTGNGMAAILFAMLGAGKVVSIELDPARQAHADGFLKYLKDARGIEFPQIQPILGGNFYQQSIQDYDLVYFYFTTAPGQRDAMAWELLQKLGKELKPGAAFVGPAYPSMILRENRDYWLDEHIGDWRANGLPLKLARADLEDLWGTVVISRSELRDAPDLAGTPQPEAVQAEITSERENPLFDEFGSRAKTLEFLSPGMDAFGISPEMVRAEIDSSSEKGGARPAGTFHKGFDRDQSKLVTELFRRRILEHSGNREIVIAQAGLGMMPLETLQILAMLAKAFGETEGKENIKDWKIYLTGYEIDDDAIRRATLVTDLLQKNILDAGRALTAERIATELQEEGYGKTGKEIAGSEFFPVDQYIETAGLLRTMLAGAKEGPFKIDFQKADLTSRSQILRAREGSERKAAAKDLKADFIFERNVTYLSQHADDPFLEGVLGQGKKLSLALWGYWIQRNLLGGLGKEGLYYIREPSTTFSDSMGVVMRPPVLVAAGAKPVLTRDLIPEMLPANYPVAGAKNSGTGIQFVPDPEQMEKMTLAEYLQPALGHDIYGKLEFYFPPAGWEIQRSSGRSAISDAWNGLRSETRKAVSEELEDSAVYMYARGIAPREARELVLRGDFDGRVVGFNYAIKKEDIPVFKMKAYGEANKGIDWTVVEKFEPELEFYAAQGAAKEFNAANRLDPDLYSAFNPPQGSDPGYIIIFKSSSEYPASKVHSKTSQMYDPKVWGTTSLITPEKRAEAALDVWRVYRAPVMKDGYVNLEEYLKTSQDFIAGPASKNFDPVAAGAFFNKFASGKPSARGEIAGTTEGGRAEVREAAQERNTVEMSRALQNLYEVRPKIENDRIPEIMSLGDKHGDSKDLETVLKAADYALLNGKELHVIIHGDAFDRGKSNARNWEIMRRLMEIAKESAQKSAKTQGDKGPQIKVDLLLGNHDALLIQAMVLSGPQSQEAYTDWVKQGGAATLSELGTKGAEDLAFWILQNFKLFVIDEKGFLHIHGGVPADKQGNPLFTRSDLEKLQKDLERMQAEVGEKLRIAEESAKAEAMAVAERVAKTGRALKSSDTQLIKTLESKLGPSLTGEIAQFFATPKDLTEKKAFFLYWVREFDWLQNFSKDDWVNRLIAGWNSLSKWLPTKIVSLRVDKSKVDRFLQALGVNGVVFGHNHLSGLWYLNDGEYRLFCVAVEQGDPGHLRFNNEGIQFKAVSRGPFDLVASKSEVLLAIDDWTSRLEMALKTETARPGTGIGTDSRAELRAGTSAAKPRSSWKKSLWMSGIVLALSVAFIGQWRLAQHWADESTGEYDPGKVEVRLVVGEKNIANILATGKGKYVSNANPFEAKDGVNVPSGFVREKGKDINPFNPNSRGWAMAKAICLVDNNGFLLIIPTKDFNPSDPRYSPDKYPDAFQAGPMIITEGVLNPKLEEWYPNFLSGRKVLIGADESGKPHTLDLSGMDIFGQTGPSQREFLRRIESWRTLHHIRNAFAADGGHTGNKFTHETPPTALMVFPRAALPISAPKIAVPGPIGSSSAIGNKVPNAGGIPKAGAISGPSGVSGAVVAPKAPVAPEVKVKGPIEAFGPSLLDGRERDPNKIEAVQLELIKKGYKIGKPDKQFGPKTRKALEQALSGGRSEVREGVEGARTGETLLTAEQIERVVKLLSDKRGSGLDENQLALVELFLEEGKFRIQGESYGYESLEHLAAGLFARDPATHRSIIEDRVQGFFQEELGLFENTQVVVLPSATVVSRLGQGQSRFAYRIQLKSGNGTAEETVAEFYGKVDQQPIKGKRLGSTELESLNYGFLKRRFDVENEQLPFAKQYGAVSVGKRWVQFGEVMGGKDFEQVVDDLRMARGPLDREASELIGKAAYAVGEMTGSLFFRTNGCFFGDLKPANFVITQMPVVGKIKATDVDYDEMIVPSGFVRSETTGSNMTSEAFAGFKEVFGITYTSNLASIPAHVLINPIANRDVEIPTVSAKVSTGKSGSLTQAQIGNIFLSGFLSSFEGDREEASAVLKPFGCEITPAQWEAFQEIRRVMAVPGFRIDSFSSIPGIEENGLWFVPVVAPFTQNRAEVRENELTRDELVQEVGKYNAAFLFMGHGKNNQFRKADIETLRRTVGKIVSDLDQKWGRGKWVAIYGGDKADLKNPDIGYAMMIMKGLGVPLLAVRSESDRLPPEEEMADRVHYYPTQLSPNQKPIRGGIWYGEPEGGTAVYLTEELKQKGLQGVYALGGGQTSLEEFQYAQKLGIETNYVRFKVGNPGATGDYGALDQWVQWGWVRPAAKLLAEYSFYLAMCGFGLLEWNMGVFATIVAAELSEVASEKTVIEKAHEGNGKAIALALGRYAAIFSAFAFVVSPFAGFVNLLYFFLIDHLKLYFKWDPIKDIHRLIRQMKFSATLPVAEEAAPLAKPAVEPVEAGSAAARAGKRAEVRGEAADLGDQLASRLQSAGLLNPILARYWGAIRNRINQDRQLKTAIIGAAGAGISELPVILGDSVSELFLVDMAYGGLAMADFDAMRKAMAKDPEAYLKENLHERYKDHKAATGFSNYKFIETRENMLAAIALELQAMGADFNEMKVVKMNGSSQLRFTLKYAGGDVTRDYTLSFIYGDIADPDNYPSSLRSILEQKVDIYFQKAGYEIPQKYNSKDSFVHALYDGLQPGGFFVTDDWGRNPQFRRNGFGPSKEEMMDFVSKFPLKDLGAEHKGELERITIDNAASLMTFSGEPDGKRWRMSGYGWELNLRQKPRSETRVDVDGMFKAVGADPRTWATPEGKEAKAYAKQVSSMSAQELGEDLHEFFQNKNGIVPLNDLAMLKMRGEAFLKAFWAHFISSSPRMPVPFDQARHYISHARESDMMRSFYSKNPGEYDRQLANFRILLREVCSRNTPAPQQKRPDARKRSETRADAGRSSEPTVLQVKGEKIPLLVRDFIGTLMRPGMDVLEMGIGSGVLTQVLVQRTSRLKDVNYTGVDINPAAVRMAQETLGEYKNVTVMESDLFSAFKNGEKFDVMFWNPPWSSEVGDGVLALAKSDPGFKTLLRFLETARGFLKPGGKIFLIMPENAMAEIWEAAAKTYEIEGKGWEKTQNYRIGAYELTPKDAGQIRPEGRKRSEARAAVRQDGWKEYSIKAAQLPETIADDLAVISPVFNEESQLQQVIDHAREAGYIGRLIFVDDGSNDRTAAVLEKNTDVFYISFSVNRQKEGAIQKAAEYLKEFKNFPPYFVALDGDSFMNARDGAVAETLQNIAVQMDDSGEVARPIDIEGQVSEKSNFVEWVQAVQWYFMMKFRNIRSHVFKGSAALLGGGVIFNTDKFLEAVAQKKTGFAAGDLEIGGIISRLGRTGKPVTEVTVKTEILHDWGSFMQQRERWYQGTWEAAPGSMLALTVGLDVLVALPLLLNGVGVTLVAWAGLMLGLFFWGSSALLARAVSQWLNPQPVRDVSFLRDVLPFMPFYILLQGVTFIYYVNKTGIQHAFRKRAEKVEVVAPTTVSRGLEQQPLEDPGWPEEPAQEPGQIVKYIADTFSVLGRTVVDLDDGKQTVWANTLNAEAPQETTSKEWLPHEIHGILQLILGNWQLYRMSTEKSEQAEYLIAISGALSKASGIIDMHKNFRGELLRIGAEPGALVPTAGLHKTGRTKEEALNRIELSAYFLQRLFGEGNPAYLKNRRIYEEGIERVSAQFSQLEELLRPELELLKEQESATVEPKPEAVPSVQDRSRAELRLVDEPLIVMTGATALEIADRARKADPAAVRDWFLRQGRAGMVRERAEFDRREAELERQFVLAVLPQLLVQLFERYGMTEELAGKIAAQAMAGGTGQAAEVTGFMDTNVHWSRDARAAMARDREVIKMINDLQPVDPNRSCDLMTDWLGEEDEDFLKVLKSLDPARLMLLFDKSRKMVLGRAWREVAPVLPIGYHGSDARSAMERAVKGNDGVLFLSRRIRDFALSSTYMLTLEDQRIATPELRELALEVARAAILIYMAQDKKTQAAIIEHPEQMLPLLKQYGVMSCVQIGRNGQLFVNVEALMSAYMTRQAVEKAA